MQQSAASPLTMMLVTKWSCRARPSSVALLTTLVSGPRLAVMIADLSWSSAKEGWMHAHSSTSSWRPCNLLLAMCYFHWLTCGGTQHA